MNATALAIPLLFIGLFAYALVKKVKLYDGFTAGAKKAIPLVVSLFPYLAAILILSELFERSGLSSAITSALTPVFSAMGVPAEISPLLLMKPFSGSGSTAILSEILASNGADGYVGRCACVCYGSSETVFYISALYFAGTAAKTPVKSILIALFSNFAAMILGCLLCRFL